jgi:glycosyltransferase involved in cell wall biosynthesis
MSATVSLLLFDGFRNDSRVLKEAMSLVKHGFKIRVIGIVEDGLPPVDVVGGIPVQRIDPGKSGGKSKLRQLVRYIRFYFKTAALCSHDDILHCNDLNTLPVGFLVKVLHNKKTKIVYDAHEYETETNWLGGYRKMLSRILEKMLIHFADVVITVSRSIAREYMRLYGIEEPVLVLNTPPLTSVAHSNALREALGIPASKKIFLYQGGLTQNRGVEPLLEAFQKIDLEAVVVFLGYGDLAPMIQERAARSDSIYYHEAVPFDKLLHYTASADFGLSLIENSCLNYFFCLPNKLFEYAMADIPVLVSPLFEMKKVVEESGIGIVLADHSTSAIVAAVSQALQLPQDGFSMQLKKFREQYNWEAQEKTLLACYETLLASA